MELTERRRGFGEVEKLAQYLKIGKRYMYQIGRRDGRRTVETPHLRNAVDGRTGLQKSVQKVI